MNSISIVTICYNAEKEIEKTLKSVLDLDYDKIQYIIIDGLSKDKTNDIIKKYIPRLEGKNIEVVYISERDRGIYDAMNKGIELATNEWINFMNAGDTFSDEKVLKDIFGSSQYEDVDIIYGNANYVTNGVKRLRIPSKLDKMYFYMALCHQSIFTRTSSCKEHKFNTKYRIAADYHMFLCFYINNYRFKYVNRVISDFCTDGVSNTKPLEALKEDRMVRKDVIKKDVFLLYRIAGDAHVFISRCIESFMYRRNNK